MVTENVKYVHKCYFDYIAKIIYQRQNNANAMNDEEGNFTKLVNFSLTLIVGGLLDVA